MAETPNHEYNAPPDGTTDWADEINANWNALDTDVEIRDANGNRGAYTPKQGAKFLATDTGDVYIGDGANWIPLGAIGGGGSSTGYGDEDAQDAVGYILGTYFDYDDATPAITLDGDLGALDGSQGTDGQVWTSTGSGAQWEDPTGGSGSVSALDSGTLGTLISGGGAQDFRINGVTSTATTYIGSVALGPTSDPGLSADYGFNWDWWTEWDDSAGAIDVVVTVEWQSDPGSDISLDYAVYEGGGGGGTTSYTDSDAIDAINNDADHGSTAQHDYYTDSDAQTAVEGSVDAADLTGASGADGQVLTSDGTSAAWENAPSGSGGGIDIENVDGTTLVTGANPIEAGADLEWTDDGDGSATLDFTGSAGSNNLVRLTIGDGEWIGEDVTDLGQTVSNLHSNGVTAIHVTQPATEPYTWSSDVTIDTSTAPIHLYIDDQVEIEYTGTGIPITAEHGGANYGNYDVAIEGGTWSCTQDPTAWLRLDDQTGFYVSPNVVDFGAGHTGTLIEVRNVDGFSELGTIDRCRLRGGNGINYIPASETGGTGTDSFQGNTIRDVQINNFATDGFGIRLSGIWMYNQIRRPNIFPNGEDSHGIRLNTTGGGTGAMGTTIMSLQGETTASVSGAYAVGVGPDYSGFYGPLFINPRSGGSAAGDVDPNKTDGSSNNQTVPVIDYEANEIKMGDWNSGQYVKMDNNGSLTVDGGAVNFGNSGARIEVDSGELVAYDAFGNSTTLT